MRQEFVFPVPFPITEPSFSCPLSNTHWEINIHLFSLVQTQFLFISRYAVRWLPKCCSNIKWFIFAVLSLWWIRRSLSYRGSEADEMGHGSERLPLSWLSLGNKPRSLSCNRELGSARTLSVCWVIRVHVHLPALLCPLPKQWLQHSNGKETQSMGIKENHALCQSDRFGVKLYQLNIQLALF